MKKLHVSLFFTFSFSLFTFLCGAQFSVIHNFNDTAGADPLGSLTLAGKHLYGVTHSGGVNNFGCIFSMDTNGKNYKDLLDFNDTNGKYPQGSLTVSGKHIYGTASVGGASGLYGCLFSIDTDGNHYKDIFDFNQNNGQSPQGTLILSGSTLYGMTYEGGAFPEYGVIFSVDTDGTGYIDLHDFTGGSMGEYAPGSLALSGNVLYGMTELGGGPALGDVFSIHTDGSAFNELLTFNGTNGQSPYGSLILSGKKLYGMTEAGGAGLTGLIFTIDTNGNNYKDVLDFNGTNGAQPYGDLIISGNKLYGMTYDGGGGSNNYGVIFSVDTNGSADKVMHIFNGATGGSNGISPEGALTLSGKMLYGMASGEGKDFEGTIFKIDTGTNIYTSVNQLSASTQGRLSVYPNPASDRVTIQLLNSAKANHVFLYSISGQQVMQMKTEGKQTIQVSTGNLAEGTYLLKVVLEDGSSLMNKVVIMK